MACQVGRKDLSCCDNNVYLCMLSYNTIFPTLLCLFHSLSKSSSKLDLVINHTVFDSTLFWFHSITWAMEPTDSLVSNACMHYFK